MTNRLRNVFTRGLIAIIALSAPACKTQTEKLADQLETSSSWLAAIDMAEHSWMENRVPVRFTRQLVDEGRSSLSASARAIADIRVPGVDAVTARDELLRATTTIDSLLAALDRRDMMGAGRVMPMVTAQRQTIDAMAKRAKSVSQ